MGDMRVRGERLTREDRLVEVQTQYDPTNVFSLNYNIQSAGG